MTAPTAASTYAEPRATAADRPPVVLHRPDNPPADGRAARSHRTIERIVTATLDLIERDGELRPTADQVATRAGVSRRALYLHFDSLEEVFCRAVERRTEEVFTGWQPPAGDSPLGARIDRFARSWSEVLEALLPVCRASAQYEPSSPLVAATLQEKRAWMRAAAESVFHAEITVAPADQRLSLTTALHFLTSCSAWTDLRRQGADADQASDVLRHMVAALLQP